MVQFQQETGNISSTIIAQEVPHTDQEKTVLSVIKSITVFQSTPILSAAAPWGRDHKGTVF